MVPEESIRQQIELDCVLVAQDIGLKSYLESAKKMSQLRNPPATTI
jgi:hypothetical protein